MALGTGDSEDLVRQISEMRKASFARELRTNRTVPVLQFKFLFAFRGSECLLMRRTSSAVTFGYLDKRGSQIQALHQTKAGVADKPFVIAVRANSVVAKWRTAGKFHVRYWTGEDLAGEH